MRLLLLAALTAACTAPPPPHNDPNARPLAGTRWVLSQTENHTGPTPTLEFREAGRASGFGGCNQWFAQVDRSRGALRFNAIGMTRRMCEPVAMAIERDFAERLERTQAAQVDEDTLTLIGEEGQALARFERAH